MKSERIALVITLLVLIGVPSLAFGYQKWRLTHPGVRVIELVGYAPAAGGWQPENIRINQGEKILLRVSSPDVVHGLAIPGLGVNVPEIYPGKVVEVAFVANQPGQFPFACTRWCSKDHWRMRGEIEVVNPGSPTTQPASERQPPLYQQLNIDLDGMRKSVTPPALPPSAERGQALGVLLSPDLFNSSFMRASAPIDVFNQLRLDPTLKPFSDQEIWDLVAHVWQRASMPEALETGRQLYARDCAACHGETGQGDGPAGRDLPGMQYMHPDMAAGPTNFTDATNLFSASDALLQGKILRGGMGSGMPEWGSLYTEGEMWAVVSFLRTFSFDFKTKYLLLH